MEAFRKKLKDDQERNEQLKEMLRKQGIDVTNVNFGGGANFDPDMLAKVMKNVKKDAPPAAEPAAGEDDEGVEEHVEL